MQVMQLDRVFVSARRNLYKKVLKDDTAQSIYAGFLGFWAEQWGTVAVTSNLSVCGFHKYLLMSADIKERKSCLQYF